MTLSSPRLTVFLSVTALSLAAAGGFLRNESAARALSNKPAKKAAKPALMPAHKPARTASGTSVPERHGLLPGEKLGPPPASLAADPTYENAALVVEFSSDWQSYLEPCGCVSGQYGGISRRATFFQQQSAANPNLLPVFAGDFATSQSDEDMFKTEIAFKAMSEMGYAAATIGDKELLHGSKLLRKIIQENPRLFVSANVTDGKTGKLLVQPYVIRMIPVTPEQGGAKSILRVAITGFLDKALLDFYQPQIGDAATDIHATDGIAAMQALVPKLRAMADIVIVLAHSGFPPANQLAATVPGIDLIVVGHNGGTEYTGMPKVNGATIVANGDRSRYAGEAAFMMADGKVTDIQSRIVPMSNAFPENPKFVALRDSYKPKLAKLAGGAITEKEATPVSTFFPVITANGYVGSKACATCHQGAYKVWTSSLHAHALQNLKASKKGINANRPECLKCHTVGFGQRTGFQQAAQKPELAGVGCESCHGPGLIHVNMEKAGNTMPGTITRVVPTGTKSLCVKCHDPANDPYFTYSKDVEKIRHWGEGFLNL